MDIYLLLYIGVFLKWLFRGFRNSFKDELYGEGNYTHIFKKISLDTENRIIGLTFAFVIVIITIILVNLK